MLDLIAYLIPVIAAGLAGYAVGYGRGIDAEARKRPAGVEPDQPWPRTEK